MTDHVDDLSLSNWIDRYGEAPDEIVDHLHGCADCAGRARLLSAARDHGATLAGPIEPADGAWDRLARTIRRHAWRRWADLEASLPVWQLLLALVVAGTIGWKIGQRVPRLPSTAAIVPSDAPPSRLQPVRGIDPISARYAQREAALIQRVSDRQVRFRELVAGASFKLTSVQRRIDSLRASPGPDPSLTRLRLQLLHEDRIRTLELLLHQTAIPGGAPP